MSRKIKAEIIKKIDQMKATGLSQRKIAAELKGIVGLATIKRYWNIPTHTDTTKTNTDTTNYSNERISSPERSVQVTATSRLDLEKYKAENESRTPREQQWLEKEIVRVESIYPGFFKGRRGHMTTA